MGLASALVDLGIHLERAVVGVGTLTGSVPLQWPAGQTGSIIYRLPRDPHQRASAFATTQTIVVNEGELAVVLEDGRSSGQLEPGRYRFEKKRVVGSLDIIWIRTGQQALKWGVGNVTSADHVQVSANGIIYVKVNDGVRFNQEVVQGAITLTEQDLQRYLMPRVQGVLRTVITRYGALDLQAQRDVFESAIRAGLVDAFAQLGVVILNVEVVDVGLPAEFKAVIQEATLAQHAGRASLIQANTAAQVKQLEAQAAAQAMLLQGAAQVQVMAQMQAQGIDPLRFKALEALEDLAEHPAQGIIGNDGARASLFGSVALAAMTGPGSSVTPPQMLAPLIAPNIPSAPITTPPAAPSAPANMPTDTPPPPAAAGGDSAAELQRQLDALDERLAEGKISEETYKKISARLEAKLAQLGRT
jgi:regulator of protease activity HflC (stomatin/prohibitin superfamily)